MTARPSVFFRTPLTCIPAAILRRTDGAGRWCRRRCGATMHVGAPFMTPGAGTAKNGAALRRTVYAVVPENCDIAADRPGDTSVAPTARDVRPRNCGGHPGDTSVAPTLRGVRPRNRGGPTGRARWCRRRCGATTRDDARRGAIYDARCRNGTTRPWHCVGRCTRWCRQIAILRRSSGRHKCRPYVAGCSSTILRRTDRATQVSPLRCGMFVHDIAAGRGCQRSTISTTGTVLTKSLFVT